MCSCTGSTRCDSCRNTKRLGQSTPASLLHTYTVVDPPKHSKEGSRADLALKLQNAAEMLAIREDEVAEIASNIARLTGRRAAAGQRLTEARGDLERARTNYILATDA